MRVCLCGVRGSTPAPGAEFLRFGGHTSCVAVARDDAALPSLILDAGTGIRAVPEMLGERSFSGTILLTHLHWDHVQGLPFFTSGDREDASVRLLLPEQEDGAGAETVLARAMSPPHFPMTPDELLGAWRFDTVAEGELDVEGFRVLARAVPHKGGRTYGYRISDEHSTFVYIPDHCPTAYGSGPDGCGEYHPAALELAAEADVIVHDGQLLPEELAEGERFGHASVEYAGRLADHAGAAGAVIFHHAPDRTDAALDELAERLADSGGAGLAVQGTVLEL